MRIAFATSAPSVSAEVAQFLEPAAAELRRLGMAGQQHHRRFLPERGHQPGGGIGMAGATGDHGDARLAGQPPPGVGGMHRGRLLPRMHQVDRGADRSVEQRHDVVAGKREDRIVSGAFQGAHDDVGAAEGLRHEGFGSTSVERSLSPVADSTNQQHGRCAPSRAASQLVLRVVDLARLYWSGRQALSLQRRC
jgi:hypothetical protein